MVSPPGIMNAGVGKGHQTAPPLPSPPGSRPPSDPAQPEQRGGRAGDTRVSGAPAGGRRPRCRRRLGGLRERGSPAARSEQPRPRRPTFMSLMMVWKRPPSALHSFSITASIFPARRGQDRLSGPLHCARGRARSARERFHPGSDPPPARRRFCREHAVLAIHGALPPKSQPETPSRSGGRVAYVQRSAPGLKNAQRRLTIKPPRVPTTETAKPILVQRKPPADPRPAPFKKKKKRKIFFSIYVYVCVCHCVHVPMCGGPYGGERVS